VIRFLQGARWPPSGLTYYLITWISSLPEALHVTNKAKARFPERHADLYVRATRLVRESVEAGVTVMRAFVEIDTAVGSVCLDTGLRLKSEWEGVCDIQIVGKQ
jgi:cytosine/adenosine deaminase-related metal-dependent hydrolase